MQNKEESWEKEIDDALYLFEQGQPMAYTVSRENILKSSIKSVVRKVLQAREEWFAEQVASIIVTTDWEHEPGAGLDKLSALINLTPKN